MKSIEDWKKEYEQDDFCGTTFETPKCGVLTVVGIAGRKGNKIYACHCSICHKDEEMFPDLETCTKGNLVNNGRCPCACSKTYHWNNRQYRLRIKRMNMDYKVISQEEITGALQKVKLCCNIDNHEWETTVNALVNDEHGCPKCADIKLRSGDPNDYIITRCNELNIKFHGFIGEYKSALKTKLDLECHCGNKWKPSYNNFVNNKRGCPACAKHGYSPDKAGVFYVVHWHKDDKEFLKYGITNKGEKRIIQQMNKTEYTPTILYFPEFSDGNVAAELERECHARRNELYGNNGVVSKCEFEHGYTETMNVDQYDWLNNLLYENTMCRLKAI